MLSLECCQNCFPAFLFDREPQSYWDLFNEKTKLNGLHVSWTPPVRSLPSSPLFCFRSTFFISLVNTTCVKVPTLEKTWQTLHVFLLLALSKRNLIWVDGVSRCWKISRYRSHRLLRCWKMAIVCLYGVLHRSEKQQRWFHDFGKSAVFDYSLKLHDLRNLSDDLCGLERSPACNHGGGVCLHGFVLKSNIERYMCAAFAGLEV